TATCSERAVVRRYNEGMFIFALGVIAEARWGLYRVSLNARAGPSHWPALGQPFATGRHSVQAHPPVPAGRGGRDSRGSVWPRSLAGSPLGSRGRSAHHRRIRCRECCRKPRSLALRNLWRVAGAPVFLLLAVRRYAPHLNTFAMASRYPSISPSV